MTAAAAVPQTRHAVVAGNAGTIECAIEQSVGDAEALAIVCHPHPLHGGSMSNKVVTTVARVLARHGAISVRFNFRGVGESEGAYDGGDGELADALAVTDWAADHFGGSLPLIVAGFSFGGAIAYRLAAARPARRLVTIAPAVDRIPLDTSEPQSDWLLVHGAADDIIAPETVVAWLRSRAREPRQVWLPGVGHFFHGELAALAGVIAEFLRSDEAA